MVVHDKKKKSRRVVIDSKQVAKNFTQLEIEVTGYVRSRLEDYKLGRSRLEDIWLESWAAYFGTPEALDFQRTQALETVGTVNTNWRHKINIGKAYEIVETVVGYISAAIFPNREWMTIEPEDQMHLGMAKIMRKYFADNLDDWQFKSKYIANLRQMCITGSSCFLTAWHDDKMHFEVLDNFDVYLDPHAIQSSESPIIRKKIMSRAEILENIKSGLYKNIAPIEIIELGGDSLFYEDGKNRVRQFQGLDMEAEYSMSDKILVYEFWGDIYLQGETYYNYYAVVIGEHLVVFSESPYACGKPFVFGTYTPVVRQPYGMSVFQPALGLLHALNIITNQRLDNVEIVMNQMYTKKASSILREEDVYSEPGKVFTVTEHDDLRALASNTNNVSISYTEAGTIESAIEKNTGTGPLVSTGQPRGGERVTAAEVQMVREAGSNRLSTTHKHIEDTNLIPILKNVLSIVREHEKKDKIVRISGKGVDEFNYYQVGLQELRELKFKLKPRGADYIIEQREYIQKRTAFLQLVASVPQFAEKINFEKILIDLLENWGFEDPESYLIAKQDDAELMEGGSSLQQMGGQGLVNAATEELTIDGGNSAFTKLTGQSLPEGVNASDLLEQYFSTRTTAERGVPFSDVASNTAGGGDLPLPG